MLSKEEVGNAIIRLRKLRGLSQEKFALESGIDRRYLSDIENGKRNFSFDILNRVASYFNIPLSLFIKEAEHSVLFQNVEDLNSFLIERGEEGTAYFTNPDFIDALIGISDDGRLIYSYEKMVESLMLSEGIGHEAAAEFIDYNTVRTIPYMGDKSPIILYLIEKV